MWGPHRNGFRTMKSGLRTYFGSQSGSDRTHAKPIRAASCYGAIGQLQQILPATNSHAIASGLGGI